MGLTPDIRAAFINVGNPDQNQIPKGEQAAVAFLKGNKPGSVQIVGDAIKPFTHLDRVGTTPQNSTPPLETVFHKTLRERGTIFQAPK